MTYSPAPLVRLRKLVGDLERTVQQRDATVGKLSNELKLKQREVKHQAHHIQELQDLLESSVKQNKPTADHRTRGIGMAVHACVCVCVVCVYCVCVCVCVLLVRT